MTDANITELTDQNFESEVLKASGPTLVYFWAVWSGPCRAAGRVVMEFAADNKGKLKVAKMNVDDHPQVADRYQIKDIPALLIFREGNVVGKTVGVVAKAKIEEAVKKLDSPEPTNTESPTDTESCRICGQVRPHDEIFMHKGECASCYSKGWREVYDLR